MTPVVKAAIGTILIGASMVWARGSPNLRGSLETLCQLPGGESGLPSTRELHHQWGTLESESLHSLTLLLVSLPAVQGMLGGSHRDLVCYSLRRGAVVLDIDWVVQTWDAQADVQAALGGHGVCVPLPAWPWPSLESTWTHDGPNPGPGAPGATSELGPEPQPEELCPPDVATHGLRVQLPAWQPRPGHGFAGHAPGLRCGDGYGRGCERRASGGVKTAVVPWSRVALHLHLPRTYHLAMWASTLGRFPGTTSAFVEAVHGQGLLAHPTPVVMCMTSAMVDAVLVRYLEPARYLLSLCPHLQVPLVDGARRHHHRRGPGDRPSRCGAARGGLTCVGNQLGGHDDDDQVQSHPSEERDDQSQPEESTEAAVIAVPHGAAAAYFAAASAGDGSREWASRRSQALVPSAFFELNHGCNNAPLRVHGGMIDYLENKDGPGGWRWTRPDGTAAGKLTTVLPHPGWYVLCGAVRD